ncbi:MAG: hypothetical protein FWB85_02590 [Chitinispirillia bacterium]|nr:hypothetical protein [Chitinispirillia bacterium]MCL2241312.1 hypothetical protein [Chitinispirillia bacterium]
MQTFDLHVVSIPDHKAQVAVANIIAATNRAISMQTAMDMARNPPLQLCQNLDMAEAEKYKDKLNGLGVGFRFAPVDGDLPIADGSLSDFAAIKQHNAEIGKGAVPQPDSDSVHTAGGADPVIMPAAAGGKTFTPSARQPGYMPQGSKGGGGGRYAKANGVRIGDIDGGGLAALRAQERRAKRISIIFPLVSLAIILIAYLLFVRGGGGKTPLPDKEQAKAMQEGVAKQQGQQKQSKGSAAPGGQQQAGPAADAQQQDGAQYTETRMPTQSPPKAPAGSDNARNRISNQQKQEANNYIDSARAAANAAASPQANAAQSSPAGEAAQNSPAPSIDNVIRFYRIAISFNRYNLSAWQGLLQAYRDKGAAKEVRETEEQMRALFGDRANLVSNLVKPFGELVDTYMNEEGIYRVEYKTLKRTRTDILNEAFAMTRSVRTSCVCKDISIFASTGPGRGLRVHSTSSTSMHSLAAFQSHAEIVWQD